MNLYGIIRFYTAFSGRPMGEGSIFKLEPLDPEEKSYRLGELLIADRAINIGLISKENLSKIIERVSKTITIINKNESIIKETITVKNNDYVCKIHIFSESSDENVKLLIDLKGIEGVWKL